MTADLPDHVRAAVTPKVATPQRTRTSPWRPYDSKFFRLPKGEWFFLYGPLVAWAALVMMAGSEQLSLIFAAAWVSLALIVPAFYRIPQERRRSRERYWVADDDLKTYRWHDPSGEWSYARWQSASASRFLRWVVALAMPATWWWVLAKSDATEAFWPFFILPFLVGAIVYVHRHLPTSLQPAQASRWCDTCGKRRPSSSVRQCPRCGRIAHEHYFLAVPALRRRWRDL